MTLSDRAVSYLRTAVPVLWGSLIALLLRTWPDVPPEVATALQSEAVVGAIVALSIVAWYWLWRRAEPHIPDWLTRLVLGSAAAPTYAPVTADGAAVITSLSPPAGLLTSTPLLGSGERENLASLRDALDEGDPGRVALDRILA